MNLDSVTRQLQLSANLVKKWGETELPNGRTLEEMFTYDSISFWDLVAVTVALYHVPKALSGSGDGLPYLLKLSRLYLSRWKQSAKNMKNIRLAEPILTDSPLKSLYLFLGFQAYLYKDTLQPVVKSLACDEEICAVTLCDEWSVRQSLQETAQSEVQSIWQHWNRDVKACADNAVTSLQVSIRELKSMRILPELIQNGGESLWPGMKHVFDRIFIAYLPHLVRHYAMAKHILEQHRPDIIVSPDASDPRTRLYCLLGKLMNIPTVEVQFGIYGQEAVEWQFFRADRLAAWGETSSDTLLSHGVKAEQIVITGSPRHDCMVSIDKDEISQTRAILGIPDGKTMVVFASTYLSVYDQIESPDLLNSVKRAIFRTAGLCDICLVAKPHPVEDVEATRKLSGGYPNILFVDKDDDIKKLIRACDVFVSLGSTATFDALIANKLTICPTFPGWTWSDLFVAGKAVLVPGSEDELLQTMKTVEDSNSRARVLSGLEPARQLFLERWMCKVDSKSSRRVKSLLVDMAGKKEIRAQAPAPGRAEKRETTESITV